MLRTKNTHAPPKLACKIFKYCEFLLCIFVYTVFDYDNKVDLNYATVEWLFLQAVNLSRNLCVSF